jgi:hypothetical protein
MLLIEDVDINLNLLVDIVDNLFSYLFRVLSCCNQSLFNGLDSVPLAQLEIYLLSFAYNYLCNV